MTLAVTRDTLLREIGRFLGWKRNPSEWDLRQKTDGEDILRRGVTQFYYPPALPGENRAHTWACLRPVALLATQAGVPDYDLPGDFGGMSGPLTYVGSDHQGKITKATVETLLALRNRDQDSVGFPCKYAVTPLPSTGQSAQGWTLMLHPTPQDVYELRVPYRSDPLAITASAQYPLGGQVAADALVAGCIAAADQVINDQYQGATYVTFLDKLRTAIYIDRQENFTGNLGYNGDGEPALAGVRDTGFTINGANYPHEGFFFDN